MRTRISMEVRETGKERAVVFNKAVFSLWAFMYFLWFRLILDLCVCVLHVCGCGCMFGVVFVYVCLGCMFV